MRFLVADDNELNLKVMEKLLNEIGECELVVNGQEAVDAYRRSLQEKRPFSAVFMDIMMPVMDGQQALQAIREMEKGAGIKLSRQVPAIMATALEDTKNVTQAFFRGEVSAYIVKPFDREKVLEALREADLPV
ncbi:MAG: response regulator [Desulfonatronovibrionaceae bacterium]